MPLLLSGTATLDRRLASLSSVLGLCFSSSGSGGSGWARVASGSGATAEEFRMMEEALKDEPRLIIIEALFPSALVGEGKKKEEVEE